MYTAAGRVMRKRHERNPFTRYFEAAWTYDNEGKVNTVNYFSDRTYTYACDALQRLVSAVATGPEWGHSSSYPSNKRIWKKKPDGSERFTLFGLQGEGLVSYSYSQSYGYLVAEKNVWFAGKLIWAEGSVAVNDRLGSEVSGGKKYFPYGEEPTTTAQDKTKFATYYRDATTALDYANQRYYGRTIGRFLTADPYSGSVSRAIPQSWNRYTYVQGDPVNANDRSGLDMVYRAPGRAGYYVNGVAVSLIGAPPPGPQQRYPCCVGVGEGAELTECEAEIIDFGTEEVGPSRRQQRLQERWDEAQEKLSNTNDLLQQLSPLVQSPCAQDLAAIQAAFGKTLTDIKIQANISDWNDASTSTDLERDLYSLGTPAYNFWDTKTTNNTIGDYFRIHPDTKAQSALAISGLTGNIYFRPNYVNGLRTTRVAALLTHELLHNFGFEDPQVQTALGLLVSRDTNNITRKLFDDCFK